MDEQALVRRAAAGDRSAFRELVIRHRDSVSRLVFRLLSGSHETEDVVQEVFVQVHRSLPTFRGESRFSTWLYRLTTNVVRMHRRKARSRPTLVAEREETHGDAQVGHGPSPVHAAERAERLLALERLLAKLSDKKREVIVLHDLQGVPAAEIAQIVDAPLLTVRTRLFYARRELYAALADEPALAEAASWIAEPSEEDAEP